MLSNRHCQLLTAYVDGVLSARRRKVVLKLLRQVPEARQLLKELEENAEGLRRLPVVKPDPGFPAHVVQAIKTRAAETAAARAAPARPAATRKLPAWVAVAAAAAVLAAITFGSYLFFSQLGHKAQDQIVDEGGDKRPPKTAPHPLVNSLITGIHQGYNKPVGVRIAAVDLSKPATKDLLTKEARENNAMHVDLAMRNDGKAAKRLVDALKSTEIMVFVDGQAQARLEESSPQTEYVVYAENLEPADLAAILGKFGAEGKAASVQSVQVSALGGSHRKELSRMLGVEERELPPPPMELHNPIPAPNGKKDKKDKGTDPDPITPSAKQLPLAMVMVLAPGSGSRSDQIERFLATRTSLRPGSLQVVFVIHQA